MATAVISPPQLSLVEHKGKGDKTAENAWARPWHTPHGYVWIKEEM